MVMGKATWGRLTDAWPGEAVTFTPKLAERLDLLGEAVELPLLAGAATEVASTGGRRIDILGATEDETAYVVENQYGAADHDHLTRGLAYAVAKSAHGLIIVAERHREEFRAVADYLNDVAVRAGSGGIKIWLVEARAIKVDDSAWAPVFDVVVSPNAYVEAVARSSSGRRSVPLDDYLEDVAEPATRSALEVVRREAAAAGWTLKATVSGLGIWAKGPGQSGDRAILTISPHGGIVIPFGAFAGQNTGIGIPALCTDEFIASCDELFGLRRTKAFGSSAEGWLTEARVVDLIGFCRAVATAYAESSG